jgi:hypothetical protein
VILDVLAWLAVADVVVGSLLAGLIYIIGRRRGADVTIRRAVGLAAMLGLPAAVLYLAVWLVWQIA